MRPALIHPARFFSSIALVGLLSASHYSSTAQGNSQGTRLLRQPSLSATQIAFEYGGDIWVAGRSGGEAKRLTSTPATESDPHFSPDGQWIAFTSNRSGAAAVYVVATS